MNECQNEIDYGEELSNTYGAVFIKVQIGKEDELHDWIKKMITQQRCDSCDYPGKEYCKNVRIPAASSLSGNFDIMLCIYADYMENIEKFVLYCIRKKFGGSLVLDTQTIAGLRIHV